VKNSRIWSLLLAGVYCAGASAADPPGNDRQAAQLSTSDPDAATIHPVPQPGEMRAEQYAALHKYVKEHGAADSPRVAFLGDSITEGWTERGADAWKKYFERLNPINLGMGGDETQHVLWRIDHGSFEGYTPAAIVLMIGTNNLANSGHTPAETARGIEAVVNRLRDKFPKANILLLGILPRGAQAADPMRARVAEVNKTISKLQDNRHVFFLDIGDVFVEKDGSISPQNMPDALHLSPAAYNIWAKAISEAVYDAAGAPKANK